MAERAHEKKLVEIWEAQTVSNIMVWKQDRRTDSWTQERVGGPNGPKRIQLTTDEREYNQELVPEENATFDPFGNGMLLCVQGPLAEEHAKTKYQKTDAQLIEMLALDLDALAESLEGFESESFLRRLLDVAFKNATAEKHEYIKNLVDSKFVRNSVKNAKPESTTD